MDNHKTTDTKPCNCGAQRSMHDLEQLAMILILATTLTGPEISISQLTLTLKTLAWAMGMPSVKLDATREEAREYFMNMPPAMYDCVHALAHKALHALMLDYDDIDMGTLYNLMGATVLSGLERQTQRHDRPVEDEA